MEMSCLCICKILDFGVNLNKLNAMDRIVLEVDDSTGKIYRNFSPESKQQFNQVISLMLKKAVNDTSLPDYKKKLDEIGFKAVAAGLTPEILAELLKSND
jgi:hypothetical protein